MYFEEVPDHSAHLLSYHAREARAAYLKGDETTARTHLNLWIRERNKEANMTQQEGNFKLQVPEPTTTIAN